MTKMTKTVELSTIVDAIESQIEESRSFLDRQTGEIHFLTSEELEAVEYRDDALDLENYPERQRSLIELGRLIFDDKTGRYVTLPDTFEVHEYRALEGFSEEQSDPEAYEQLFRAIRGRGAFRRFKECVYRLGVEDQWYKYRDEFLRQIARDWCERNDLPYQESS